MTPFKEQHISLLVILSILSPEILSKDQKDRVKNHNLYMRSPDADEMLFNEITKGDTRWNESLTLSKQ